MAEARKQVMEATERLGGQYSPNLHPQCTHLVVQISFSFKFNCMLCLLIWMQEYILIPRVDFVRKRVERRTP